MRCYCSRCFPYAPECQQRTVQKHLQSDKAALAICVDLDQRTYLQQRIDLTIKSLAGQINGKN